MKPRMNSIDRLRLLFEETDQCHAINRKPAFFRPIQLQGRNGKKEFSFCRSQCKWKLDEIRFGAMKTPMPLTEEDFMDANTPLLKAFRMLVQKRRFFIKDDDGNPAYIVTKTDLDKIPLRIGIFGLISLFETHLKDLIRKQLPNWEETASQKTGWVRRENCMIGKKQGAKKLTLSNAFNLGIWVRFFQKATLPQI
jgi:hypothetical protein